MTMHALNQPTNQAATNEPGQLSIITRTKTTRRDHNSKPQRLNNACCKHHHLLRMTGQEPSLGAECPLPISNTVSISTHTDRSLHDEGYTHPLPYIPNPEKENRMKAMHVKRV